MRNRLIRIAIFVLISINLTNLQPDYKALHNQILLILLQIGKGIYTQSSASGFPPYQQDSAVQELSTQKIQHVESVDGEEQGQPQRSYEQQEKNVHEKLQRTLYRVDREKIYEPCPRWSGLSVFSTCGYVIISHVRSVLNFCCIAEILLE